MTKLLIATTIEMTMRKFFLPYGDYFRSLGWQVDCLSNPENLPFEECAEHFDKRLFISWTRCPYDISNFREPIRRIKKLVEEEKYDIVHVHTPVAAFISRMALRDLQKNGKVKVIYTAHGFHFYKGAPIMNWLLFYQAEKWLAKYTDALITINDEDYNLAISNNFRSGKIWKIPGVGIDLTKFNIVKKEEKYLLRERYGFKQEDFLLVFAGDYNRNKNQEFLIRAMKEIIRHDCSIKLLLAGEGPYKYKFEKLIKELDLCSNVFIREFFKDMPSLISVSDIGVSASIREGLPLNIIENEACGLPVVASDNRGHREIIQNGVNGFLFKIGDMKSFVDHILDLRRNNDLYSRISNKCRPSIEKYDLTNILKQTEGIYRDVLKQ